MFGPPVLSMLHIFILHVCCVCCCCIMLGMPDCRGHTIPSQNATPARFPGSPLDPRGQVTPPCASTPYAQTPRRVFRAVAPHNSSFPPFISLLSRHLRWGCLVLSHATREHVKRPRPWVRKHVPPRWALHRGRGGVSSLDPSRSHAVCRCPHFRPLHAGNTPSQMRTFPQMDSTLSSVGPIGSFLSSDSGSENESCGFLHRCLIGNITFVGRYT